MDKVVNITEIPYQRTNLKNPYLRYGDRRDLRFVELPSWVQIIFTPRQVQVKMVMELEAQMDDLYRQYMRHTSASREESIGTTRADRLSRLALGFHKQYLVCKKELDSSMNKLSYMIDTQHTHPHVPQWLMANDAEEVACDVRDYNQLFLANKDSPVDAVALTEKFLRGAT